MGFVEIFNKGELHENSILSRLAYELWSQIAQNSVKYYSFIEYIVIKSADILSTSTRYRKMFEKEQRVQEALADLYLEIMQLLQRLKVTISKSCEFGDAPHDTESK